MKLKTFKIIAAVTMNAAVLSGMAAVAATNINEAKAVKEKEVANSEIMCLAQNIYYETHARTEVDAYSVADVVMNRVVDNRYPNTVCGVVKQGKKLADGSMKRNACQFSWYCDGKSDNPRKGKAWDNSLKYAIEFYNDGKGRGITQGADHYHSQNVTPYWAADLEKVGRIGSHTFYRWN